MTGAMRPVPDDHPMMLAYTEYKQTADYANTLRWCPTHSEGSLWAAFCMGWNSRAPDPRVAALVDAYEAALAALEAERDALREALRPFADFYEKAEQFVADHAKDGGSPIMPSSDFRLSYFRRARAAMGETGK